MTMFEELKQRFRTRYSEIKTLPLITRLKIFMNNPSEFEESISTDVGLNSFTQTAVLVEYEGKTYLKKFGRIQ